MPVRATSGSGADKKKQRAIKATKRAVRTGNSTPPKVAAVSRHAARTYPRLTSRVAGNTAYRDQKRQDNQRFRRARRQITREFNAPAPHTATLMPKTSAPPTRAPYRPTKKSSLSKPKTWRVF